MPKNPHADFSPVLNGYSGIGAFRFWCQTALPLTYDDSLSYYELLCKVVNYLNHAIEDLSNVEENTGKLAEAYTQLQNYVNEYFDKLDIEAELRNVLDAMAQDGTLDALLDPLVTNHLPGVVDDKIDDVVADQIDDTVAGQIGNTVAQQLPGVVAADIPAQVTNWLNANVNPVGSAVTVDNSLTISGSAADAKVTGDELSDLKTQINNSIKMDSTNIYNNVLTNGSVNVVTGDFTPGNTTKCTDMLPVVPGKYLVSAYNNSRLEMFLVALFDANETIIPETVQRTGDGTQRATGYILIPDNCAFVRVTYVNANAHAENKLYLLDEVDYNPSNLYIKYLILNNGNLLPFNDIVKKSELDNISDIIDELEGKINDSIYYQNNNIYNNVLTNGSVNVISGNFTPGTTAKCTDMLQVIPGKYLVSAYNNARLEMFTIALFDANETIIPETVQRTGDGTQRATGYILIPDNCAFVRVTYVNANAHAENKLYLLDEVDYNPSNLYIKSLLLDNGDVLPFADIVSSSRLERSISSAFAISHKYYKQKVVAMGDSITNGQSWFDGAAAYFGIRPVNKGVPGSTVSSVGSNGFCTDERVNDIPTDTKVLLLMGGINDWLSNVPLGNKTLDNVDTTTFYGAVNVLIQKLNARIPDATIICMGATFGIYPNKEGFDDTTGIYNNLELCSLDYGKAFCDMCELNGVKSFMIGYECGWNKNNYSTFIDYDGAYLHPNATGGARMAEVIADNIP